MPLHLRHTMLRDPHIAIPNLARPAPAAQHGSAPTEARHAREMPAHRAHEGGSGDIVHLNRAARKPDGEVAPVFGELDATDVLVSFLSRFSGSDGTEDVDDARLGVPDVDALA